MSLGKRDDTVVVDTTGWRGEHQARGAEEKYMREAPEALVLTQEHLRSLEGRDPMAAALLSVVSFLPPSEDAPDPEAQAAMENVATAKVKALRKAGQKGKEKEPMKAIPCSAPRGVRGSKHLMGKYPPRRPMTARNRRRTGYQESLPRRYLQGQDHFRLVGCAPSPCAWKEVYLHVWLPLNSVWMRPWNSFPGFWGLGMKILI